MDKEIKSLMDSGDKCFDKGEYESAIKLYRKAVSLVPEPFIDQSISTELLTAIGDTYFKMGNYDEADKVFSDVMLCPGATANAYIRLRRGQIALELDNKKKAKTELACAYMNGGTEIFENEDKKYFDFIKTIMKAVSKQ